MGPISQALAALIRAQLRQRDYLTPEEIAELEAALRALEQSN